MNQKTLILIRHSLSKLDPDLPPHQWGLTEEGRQRCIPLARHLTKFKPEIIITSTEPKAIQTGEVVAQQLGISYQTLKGLHEHERIKGIRLSQEEWQNQITRFFSNPDSLIFGKETAHQALTRFSNAIEHILTTSSQKTIAIASHGTVMALFYGKITHRDPYLFWQKLGLPAFYVVKWPEYQLTSQMLSIETFE